MHLIQNSQYLMLICRLRNLKFPRSLANAWIFQRPNHFSTGSEQKTNPQLAAHWQNDILCFEGHGGLVSRETVIRHNAPVLLFMQKKEQKHINDNFIITTFRSVKPIIINKTIKTNRFQMVIFIWKGCTWCNQL